MREAGFTVVRTYTAAARRPARSGARAGACACSRGVFYPDWRYLLGASRRQQRADAREAARGGPRGSAAAGGDEQVLGLSLGNEVPADVLRWHGTRRGRRRRSASSPRSCARRTPTSSSPTRTTRPPSTCRSRRSTSSCSTSSSSSATDFRRYLTRLHHLAGDRPLVLGEVGLDAGDDAERRAAPGRGARLAARDGGRARRRRHVRVLLDRRLVGRRRTPSTGWRFGLTRADRSPRPALRVAARWNQRTVRDLDVRLAVDQRRDLRPQRRGRRSTSACATRARSTTPTSRSSWSTTARPTRPRRSPRRHPARPADRDRARRPRRRPQRGLRGGARATLIAYLDADAYPTPGVAVLPRARPGRPDVGGVGGPNLPPRRRSARRPRRRPLARGPGARPDRPTTGPSTCPGCNMAFWKLVLDGGRRLRPRLHGGRRRRRPLLAGRWTAAGRSASTRRPWSGTTAASGPARLPAPAARLRAQRGAGRGPPPRSLHPRRHGPLARAHLQLADARRSARQRIYRGLYGAAAYQSVYQAGGHSSTSLHQVGVPLAVACCC